MLTRENANGGVNYAAVLFSRPLDQIKPRSGGSFRE
jgi:hypothetical protein